MKITSGKIDEYVDEMLTILKEDTETINEFKTGYQKSKDRVEVDQLNYCIEKYVNSELDYTTEGIRGLGRASEFWPRLGGYFRKGVSQLTQEKRQELDFLITSLIIKSYLFQILLSNQPKEISKIKNSEELYQKWVPEIYRFDISIIPEDSRNFLFAVIEKDFDLLKKFFQDNNMKPGTFSSDKTKDILSGYISAGVTIRIIEKLSS